MFSSADSVVTSGKCGICILSCQSACAPTKAIFHFLVMIDTFSSRAPKAETWIKSHHVAAAIRAFHWKILFDDAVISAHLY